MAGDSHWRQLCQLAFLESDPAQLRIRVAEARDVVLNRIEDCSSKSDSERAALRTASPMLDSLPLRVRTSVSLLVFNVKNDLKSES